MIAWIKRLFGIKSRPHPEFKHIDFNHVNQTGNVVGGSVVGRDIVVVSGKADAGRSLVAEAIGNEVVLRVQTPTKRSKKQKKLSREQRRKQKAAR